VGGEKESGAMQPSIGKGEEESHIVSVKRKRGERKGKKRGHGASRKRTTKEQDGGENPVSIQHTGLFLSSKEYGIFWWKDPEVRKGRAGRASLGV